MLSLTLLIFLPFLQCCARKSSDILYKYPCLQERMREVQGAICVASIVQLVIGYTGLLGGLLRFITPLTIAPAVTMIGLSLFDVASLNASKHWGVAVGCEH